MTDRSPSPSSPGPNAESLAGAKAAARRAARAARDSLEPAARKDASAAASRALLALPELARVCSLLAYFALPAEINPLEAVSALRARGVAFAYPRVAAPGVLELHVVSDERELEPGTFGLSQPPKTAPVLEPGLVDAVIVPGMAFDRRGARVGYGGGYYDRLLPRLRSDCLRIGFAFDEQVLADVPAEPHDALMDLIVTPTRVIRSLTSRQPARPSLRR
jgi:5-formyltetrahydrofolate cyclo-ligase